MDLKTLSDRFVEFEKAHIALDWRLDDVYAWRLVRFDVFQALVSEQKLFEFAHPKLKNRKNNFKNHFKNIQSITLTNAFKPFKKNDFLFFAHSRNINGRDIYSHALMDHIGFENITIIYPTSPTKPYPNSIIMGWPALKIALNNIAMNRLGHCPYKHQTKDIAIFADQFRAFFQSDIRIEKLIFREMYRFKTYEAAYLKLLTKLSPKSIFMVTHYAHFGLLSAAKKLNIKTLEIQHGTISINHMGYYFPHHDNPPYMPDILLCHGDHWTRKPPLPQSLETKVIGAAHVSKLIETKTDKIKNQILIFSQGTVAKDLLNFATKSALLGKDYQFIYRLHPSEMRDAYQTHGMPENFEIRDDAKTFFDDLTRSEFIATVYSTTIYEAMACGAKGIVIGLNGHNAVADIIDNGDAALAKTPKDFADALKTAKACNNPEKYYAPINYEGLVNS